MANLPAVRTGQQLGRSPAGWADLPQYVRDEYLPQSARELVVKGIPPNTLKAYANAWRPFTRWCEAARRTSAPVTQETMITYLDGWRRLPIHNRCKCREHRPSPSTMWLWYSAVRFHHSVGAPPIPWECGELLTRAMIGYSVEMVEAGWTPRKAPRAYDSDVTRMVDALDLDQPKQLRDRAILLVNFYTASRASDLATYRLGDIAYTPKGIELTLRQSKTNRRVGLVTEQRALWANPTHPQYCGVVAIREWTAWLARLGRTTGALFRPFDKHGNLLTGPQDAVDYKMNGTSLTEAVRAAAERARLDAWADITCHSLRRGRATQQRELGVDPLDIARAYGWVPGGAINVYLEEASRWSPTAPGTVGMLTGTAPAAG